MMMSARIAPLQPPYEPAIEAQLIKWMPPNSGLDPLALFRTLAHHPNLFDRMRPLGAAILGHGTLSPAHRELLINRTCAVCGCEYEWGVHVASFGKAVGLSPEKLVGTANATPQDPVWEEQDSYLLQVVDELHQTNHLSDALWAKLSAYW